MDELILLSSAFVLAVLVIGGYWAIITALHQKAPDYIVIVYKYGTKLRVFKIMDTRIAGVTSNVTHAQLVIVKADSSMNSASSSPK